MTESHVVERRGPVLQICLEPAGTPQCHGSRSLRALREEVQRAGLDPEVRAVLLTGSGYGVLCGR